MNIRPFLKWPGGKYRLIDRIKAALGGGRRLIEPFTGSGAVFLNTRYEEYLLADSNPDLINLYQQLKQEGSGFIRYCRRLFTDKNNAALAYYKFRDEFNRTRNLRRKSALFLYLNRHCYNGLVRYNSRGEFNTPFGRYTNPYFPEREMRQFAQAADRAEFATGAFHECMSRARAGDVIYCDPPYMPLSRTACFTDYHTGGFDWEDQARLAELAGKLASRGVQVVISNHDTGPVRELYKKAGATLSSFEVRRMISADAANRSKVTELIAVFD